VIKLIIICFTLIFVNQIFVGHSANAQSLTAIRENNEAVKKLEQEDALAAEKQLLNALPKAPFDPVLRLNLGLTYEVQKKPERALKEYNTALRSSVITDEAQFYAHFNSGNASAQLKNIPQALAHYQAALKVRPDSEEVKKNIELLMQQGGGQGKGDKKDNNGQGNEQSENENKGPGENENDQPQDQGKQKPEFKSQNLSKDDVRKIMEELKSQEKKIRALEYGKQGKEAQPGKDW